MFVICSKLTIKTNNVWNLFKVNYKDSRTMCDIYWRYNYKLLIKAIKEYQFE